MPWLGQVTAVFEGFYAGQEVGTAIAALLFGDVNPSGKLPVTFPNSLADVPAHTAAQWPGNGSNAVQYSRGPQRRLPLVRRQNITPLFPFGFGLSYTSFAFSDLQVGALSGGQATVTATVTNTGSRAGHRRRPALRRRPGRRRRAAAPAARASSGSASTRVRRRR